MLNQNSHRTFNRVKSTAAVSYSPAANGRKLTRERKTERKSTKKLGSTKNQSTRPVVLDRDGARQARRPDAAMRALPTLGGRRRRGDRTPRWPEKAKTKEAGPICSAAACRARRRWARSRAACRVQATTGAAPRTRDDSDHNATDDDAALRPPAPGDAAKAERKAGVERARVHARFGTAPLRVRVAARQARVGRLPHVRRRCRLLILFAHHLAPHGHGRGGGLKPAATNLEHCAACCCCQNGRASGPACKGTEKVTDNGDSTPHACRGDGRPRATEARRQRLRASFGASQRVLAAGLSPPPRTHRRLWNRRGRRASLRSEASLASAWRPS